MTRTTLLLILTAVLALDLCGVAGAQPAYPQRTDAFVEDTAQVIEPQDEAVIRQLLQDLQAARGVEATVVTIGSIDDYQTGDKTIETFATHLFNTWGLGDAQRNDGVLILVAIDDRQVRIELGAGYDSSYQARMGTVIDEHFLADFRRGRFSQGMVSGVRALIYELTGEWPAPAPRTSGIAADSSSASAIPTNLLVILGVLFFAGMGVYTVVYVVRDALSGRSTQTTASSDDDEDDRQPSPSLFDNSALGDSSFDSSDRSSGGGGRSSGGGATGRW